MNLFSPQHRNRVMLLAVLALAAAVALAMRYGVLPVSDMQRLRARGARLVFNEYGEMKEAHLEGPRFHDVDLLRLTAFPNIESLSLKGSRVTDAGIALLSVQQDIHRLDLSGTAITGESLKTVVGFSRLWDLNLKDCPHVAPVDLEIFADTPNVSRIQFDWNRVAEQDYARLRSALGQRLPSAGSIYGDFPGEMKNQLPSVWVTLDKVTRHFGVGQGRWKSRLPKIPYGHLFTTASVSGRAGLREERALPPRPEESMQVVTWLFPRLEEIHAFGLMDADLIHLRDLPVLTTLELQGCDTLTPNGLLALADVPNLKSLTVEGVEFDYTGDGVKIVCGLHEDVLPVLASIRSLERLDVTLLRSGLPVTQSTPAPQTSSCTRLELTIEVEKTTPADFVDDIFVILPGQFPELQSLACITSRNVDLSPLVEMKQLTELTLIGGFQLAGGRSDSLQSLSGNPYLESISLYHGRDLGQFQDWQKRFSIADLEAVAGCPRVTTFRVTPWLLPDVSMEAIESALGMKQNLSEDLPGERYEGDYVHQNFIEFRSEITPRDTGAAPSEP